MNLKPVKSSMIKSVGYDKTDKSLHVEFNTGKKYKYNEVPINKYRSLMKSKSKGKYLNKNIKAKHTVEKMDLEKEALWRGFHDELSKLAELSAKDVHPGVHITNSFDELKSNMQPGDVFATKPNTFGIKSKAIQFRQLIGGNPHYKWSHAGIYAGDDHVIHSYNGLGKGKDLYKIRKHHVDTLKSHGLDVYLLRARANQEDKNKAVENAHSMINTPYSNMGIVGATFGLPLGNDSKAKKDKLTCTGLVAQSYPKLEVTLEDKDRGHLLVTDMVNSEDFEPVMAYSHRK